MPTFNFLPFRLLDPDCWYKFTYLMANSAEPTDLDLHCLQKQGISGYSRTRVYVNDAVQNLPGLQIQPSFSVIALNNRNIQINIFLTVFILFCHENIMLPHWGTSDEYPQHNYVFVESKKKLILFDWKWPFPRVWSMPILPDPKIISDKCADWSYLADVWNDLNSWKCCICLNLPIGIT